MRVVNRHAKKLQKKSRKCAVLLRWSRPGAAGFTVHSPSGMEYAVVSDGRGFRCTCPWGERWHPRHQRDCSHVLAVREWIEEQGERKLSFWASQEDAERQRRPACVLSVGLWATSRKGPGHE